MGLLFWCSLAVGIPNAQSVSDLRREHATCALRVSQKATQIYNFFRLRGEEKRWLLIGGLIVLAAAIGGFVLPQPAGGIAAGVALVVAAVVILKLVGVF